MRYKKPEPNSVMSLKYFVLPLSYTNNVKTNTYSNKVKIKMNCFQAIKINFSENKQISFCFIKISS